MTTIYQYESPRTSNWPFARRLDIVRHAEVLEFKVRNNHGETVSIKIPAHQFPQLAQVFADIVPPKEVQTKAGEDVA